MSKYSDYLRQDQRLVILRILSEMPGYRANSSVLFNVLGEYGHSPSRDQVKTEIHWLGEQGLLTFEDLSGLLIAKITERGLDVTQANIVVPGVKKPGA